MAQFSNAQVRQLYVVTQDLGLQTTPLDPTNPANIPGTIQVVKSNGGLTGNSNVESFWFEYITPNGDHGLPGVVRSDIVYTQGVEYTRLTPAAKGIRNLQQLEVQFAPLINAGQPVVGQDYILRFTFYNIGMGGPENQYIKEGGAYRVLPGDTAANVYEQLAYLAKLNFSREPYPYVKVTTDTWDPYANPATPMPGTSTMLIITEVLQPWVLGKRQAAQVFFNVNCVPLSYVGNIVPWGIVTDTTNAQLALPAPAPAPPYIVTNGRKVADMEWFYIGERADQFRGIGYPDNFVTKYLADPTAQYDILDISHFYNGRNEDIQRSTKLITLVYPTVAGQVLTTTVAPVIPGAIANMANIGLGIGGLGNPPQNVKY